MADKNDELRIIEASRERLAPLVANVRILQGDDGEVSAENREAYVEATAAVASEGEILRGAQAVYATIIDMERDDDAGAERLNLGDRRNLPEATDQYREDFENAVSQDRWNDNDISALRDVNSGFYALDGSGAGAVLVPTETERDIITDAVRESPLLSISNRRSVPWRSRKFPRGEYIGVAPPRNEGDQYLGKDLAPSSNDIKIGNYGFIMSHPNEFIDDAFGLSGHISEVIAPVFAETVEEYAVKGEGGEVNFTNQAGGAVVLDLANYDVPLGLLNETADYVAEVESAAVGVYSHVDITALRYAVRPTARNSGNWYTSSDFLQDLENMLDGQERPLWQPSIQDGQPDRLRGRGIYESEQLPPVAAGNVPAMYGRFGRAHNIFIRRGLTVRRSQHYLFGNNSEAMAVDIRWGSGVLEKGMLSRLKIKAA